MRWSLDARTPIRHSPGPVVLAEDGAAIPEGARLVERFAAPPLGAHPIGCACCQPRNPVAIALDRLFLARTRGTIPWFDAVQAVTVTPAGAAALEAALAEDSVVAARFRRDWDREAPPTR